eukprot:NODE_1361_length_1567_cov_36.627800_g1223_i0.p1 GENE.NODE_1361_length_1567_cov_36.627800_g1223_i0~~NODE_1361_length_1567_cov_36.627800_g1223_i0.p1  ORF type:complete len:292 (+),score=48.30 NODE_1361_length_1567_cov_36.627800_g1223_i0:63-878(+)
MLLLTSAILAFLAVFSSAAPDVINVSIWFMGMGSVSAGAGTFESDFIIRFTPTSGNSTYPTIPDGTPSWGLAPFVGCVFANLYSSPTIWRSNKKGDSLPGSAMAPLSQAFRVKGTFYYRTDLKMFPYNTEQLRVILEDPHYDSSELRYQPVLTEKMGDRIAGYDVKTLDAYESYRVIDGQNYSRLVAVMEVKRPVLGMTVQYVLPPVIMWINQVFFLCSARRFSSACLLSTHRYIYPSTKLSLVSILRVVRWSPVCCSTPASWLRSRRTSR